jgi:hypothetical protein
MRLRLSTLSVGRRALALAGVASVSLGVVLLPWAGQASAAHARQGTALAGLREPQRAAGSAGTGSAGTGSAGTGPAASMSAASTSAGSAAARQTASTPAATGGSASPSAGATQDASGNGDSPAVVTRVPSAPPGGAVVRGRQLYNPNTNKPYPYHSYVTVSTVSDLANQTVHVTWQGFTPSSAVTYTPTSTLYPVMVVQCPGTDPKNPNGCFGWNNGGVAATFSPYGPVNVTFGMTAANGTGEAYIQLMTAAQQPQLGCSPGKPCSLAIVPAQGGLSSQQCGNHSQDDRSGMATGALAFTDQISCSWNDRIVVPLHFAPIPTTCPVRNPDFTVIGSPMLARAMGSWQSKLCSVSDPLSIQYDSAQSEPLAREDFQAGEDDVALTTFPATGSSKYPFTYAPVAISAESLAFWVDNVNSGLPYLHMDFDARLVLKLLTQSFDFDYVACSDAHPYGLACNNAVDNDPTSLFTDPEFIRLNRNVQASPVNPWQVPTVLSGASDMTWALTSWIAANKQAKEFADGTFVPPSDHINSNYLDMQLPTNTLSAMDPYNMYAHLYEPYFPLSAVEQYQVNNWYPATQWTPDTEGNYDALPEQNIGDRDLFAILDEGAAAAYLLPTASLQNADGKFVAPTESAMLDTVEHDMVTDAQNHITQSVNQQGKYAGAYPLTMVIYAMVPTGGISKKMAADIAEWLDFVANEGQQPGEQPGNLPPGYAPLTAQMRAQTLKAASEVLNQTGDSSSSSPSPSTSTDASASPTPSASTAAATPGPSSSTPIVGLGDVANPITSGVARYAVPVLLIAGGLLALAGSFSLVIGRGGTAALAWLRRVPLPRRKKQ